MTTVCVVGLGRIGLPTAVAFARAGCEVIGVDADPDVLRAIRFRDLPHDEPGLTDTALDAIKLQAEMTFDGADVDAWILSVGTLVDGICSGAPVIRVGRSVAVRAREGALLVIESTVPPGTTAELQQETPSLLVAHCPERAAPGRILEEIQSSPRLVGGTTPKATTAAIELYARLGAPTIRCTAREAEFTKLAENASRAAEIAFANELATHARDEGIDPFRIVELANTHPRVNMLRPGLGVGGKCLPMALAWASRNGTSPVASGARKLNVDMPRALVARMRELVPGAERVAVLGTTYKPGVRYRDSHLDESSPAVALIGELENQGYRVDSHDPSDGGVPEILLERSDVVIFGCPHAAFADINPPNGAGRAMLDPVGAVDPRTWAIAGWTVSR